MKLQQPIIPFQGYTQLLSPSPAAVSLSPKSAVSADRFVRFGMDWDDDDSILGRLGGVVSSFAQGTAKIFASPAYDFFKGSMRLYKTVTQIRKQYTKRNIPEDQKKTNVLKGIHTQLGEAAERQSLLAENFNELHSALQSVETQLEHITQLEERQLKKLQQLADEPFETAIVYFQMAMKDFADANAAEPGVERAKGLRNFESNIRTALKCLLKASKTDSSQEYRALAAFWAGNILELLGYPEIAIEQYLKALSAEGIPQEAGYYYQVGRERDGQNKPEEALLCYRLVAYQAEKADIKYYGQPHQAALEGYSILAQGLVQNKHLEEAEAILKKALEVQRALPRKRTAVQLYEQLGDVLTEQHRTTEAESQYLQAYTLATLLLKPNSLKIRTLKNKMAESTAG